MSESVVDFSHARFHGSLDDRVVARVCDVDGSTIIVGDILWLANSILSAYGVYHHTQNLAQQISPIPHRRRLPNMLEINVASLNHAVTFAVLLPALLVAHNIADHWLQTDHQANNKGSLGWPGRAACARHVISYTLLTTATTGMLWCAFRLPINPVNFILGQSISALSHYWADRRFTLARLCSALGKSNFYKLGSPRPEHDDNPSLGTGAYVLDQAWHWGWLGIAAFITAI